MANRIGPLFDERFLDKHAGSIIGDSAVAIVRESGRYRLALC
jgi:hypothetical protein